MKRFILFVSLVGAAVSGFLWWKRREVMRAETVAQDPWPSVVAEAPAVTPSPVTPSPVTPDPTEPPEPKKVPRKTTKKAIKKPEADPTQ